MFKTYETELAGRKLVIETGKMAGLANGSVLVRYGDTCVLVNVTASKEPREGIIILSRKNTRKLLKKRGKTK